LQNHVGSSGRPVVIVQHYPMSSSWWTDSDKTDFINKIKDYNVVGFFAGHTHRASVDPYSYQDSKNHSLTLDTFTNATGGEQGRGELVAARYSEEVVGSHTDAYLDVATGAWDNLQGPYLARPDQLSDTDPPSISPAAGMNGYYGGLPGCRKRINVNF